jgi:hypothetical protein
MSVEDLNAPATKGDLAGLHDEIAALRADIRTYYVGIEKALIKALYDREVRIVSAFLYYAKLAEKPPTIPPGQTA